MIRLLDYNAIFFHVPKTGGTWIHRFLEEIDLNIEVYNPHGFPHTSYHEEQITNQFTSLFIRHPFTWYRSFWGDRKMKKWENWKLDRECGNNNFEQFLLNIINQNIPYVTNMYNWYIGDAINYIGKQETLDKSLFEIFNLLKIPCSLEKIKSYPKINCSKEIPTCSGELKERICNLEKETIEKYYND